MNPDELSLISRTLPADRRQFDEPWQARAFALAVVTVESLGLPWDAFRDHLKSAIADVPDRPYWQSWLAALEDLTRSVFDLPEGSGRSKTEGLQPPS